MPNRVLFAPVPGSASPSAGFLTVQTLWSGFAPSDSTCAQGRRLFAPSRLSPTCGFSTLRSPKVPVGGSHSQSSSTCLESSLPGDLLVCVSGMRLVLRFCRAVVLIVVAREGSAVRDVASGSHPFSSSCSSPPCSLIPGQSSGFFFAPQTLLTAISMSAIATNGVVPGKITPSFPHTTLQMFCCSRKNSWDVS